MIPDWLLRDLEDLIREKRTAKVTLDLKAGEICGGVHIDEFKRAPVARAHGEAPCGRCGKGATLYDNGRRAVCLVCGEVTVFVVNGARSLT